MTTNHNIHTTNIVGAWVPVGKDYDFENDFEAPNKLFWCKGPHGDGYWSNDELWEDINIHQCIPWFKSNKLKITHWAWVTGPKDEWKEIREGLENGTYEFKGWEEGTLYKPPFSMLKVGEPKE